MSGEHCSAVCAWCGRCDGGTLAVERTCIVCHAPFMADVDDREYQMHVMCLACAVAAQFAAELRDRAQAS